MSQSAPIVPVVLPKISYHIHIGGMVQGVGFRPLVNRLALQYALDGFVNNDTDGVNIYCSGREKDVFDFYQNILQNPPQNAHITQHTIHKSNLRHNQGFGIEKSVQSNKTSLLLTPDIGICANCLNEIRDKANPRFHYPFTTCLDCGPRYSIVSALPYDRPNTTMQHLDMCDRCNTEYKNVQSSRHHSQTNSCGKCTIPIHFFDSQGVELCFSFEKLTQLLEKGGIIAVKGTGGFLLFCDATNEIAIHTLRVRKHRPDKPFALLYASLEMMSEEVVLEEIAIKELTSPPAPIVLCPTKGGDTSSRVVRSLIAPHLNTLGVMLPNSALMQLIADDFGKPLVATSANVSGSPIFYKEEDALEHLTEIADFILTYDRAIVTPQDDSVVRFTKQQQRIILRRSRGLAPNYFPTPASKPETGLLAMGADLKNTFAISTDNYLYISQFLGDQSSFEAQNAFDDTLRHLCGLVNFAPKVVLTDKHPYYLSTQKGQELSVSNNIPLHHIQHHQAHFAAVLAEHNLFETPYPVLGVIWDGTGYGNDGNIWGGEFFNYQYQQIARVAHLEYFPQILSDKMSKEPRLSAFALLNEINDFQNTIKEHFTAQEWHYLKKIIQHSTVKTSSMGRFIDGVACILGLCTKQTYEGQAAMELESLASQYLRPITNFYTFKIAYQHIEWQSVLQEIMQDLEQGIAISLIAKKCWYSLAQLVFEVANHLSIKQIAVSGGVFQNALLVDALIELCPSTFSLYFHKNLSPNDECISFGQIAYYQKFILKK
jgi:hydrogenase maturation protein HypF